MQMLRAQRVLLGNSKRCAIRIMITAVQRRFAVYVHIPYCRSRCPYCGFNTYAVVEPPEREYLTALRRELSYRADTPEWAHGVVSSIYVGGGTPTVFSPRSIGDLLRTIERCWPRTRLGEIEVTAEANPGTVDIRYLAALRDQGVNRISFGVQSFQPHILQRLGRGHGAAEGSEAVDMARQAGFHNVSVDLLFAVPGQTLADWERDLETIIDLRPEHVSAYSLTFEPGTPFEDRRARGAIRAVEEEVEAAMLERTAEVLSTAGYQHYEISNYAEPGRESRHNLNYWRRGEYLGVGAGAHSFLCDSASDVRWSNEPDPDAYVRRVGARGEARVFVERLSEDQAHAEFVFLGLRLLAGIDTREFAARFGVEFTAAFPQVCELEAGGLLVREGTRWRLSQRGLMVADSVCAAFL